MIYKVSEQSAAAEKSNMLKRTAFINSAIVGVAMLVIGRPLLQQGNAAVIAIWIAIAGTTLCWAVWYSLRRIKRIYKETFPAFQITTDDLSISKTQPSTPDVTLLRTAITKVEEFQGKGFRICTADRFQNIWAPSELDDYEQLKAEVLSIPGVVFTTSASSWPKSYLVIAAMLVVFAVSVVLPDSRLAAGASVALGCSMFWLFFKNYRNPNLTDRTRREFLLWAFMGVCFLIRAFFQWRA